MVLTEEQSDVARHEAGHALVVAVAGSGKSTALVSRILWLLETGVDPGRILVLMFNKSAQADFSSRLSLVCDGTGFQPPVVRTFHSFGLRLCRSFVDQGWIEDAAIDDSDRRAKDAVIEVLREHNPSVSGDDRIDPSPENVGDIIEAWDALKGELYSLTGIVPAGVNRACVGLWGKLEAARLRLAFRGFTDMIADPVLLMENSLDARCFCANRYDHILVDEFQDVNEAQCRLLRFLAGSRASVMAVGDDDQTIYRFRGARPEYMVSSFEQIFPGATRYQLTRTFRFGRQLAECANRVISRNSNRVDKVCQSAGRCDTAVECRMSPRPGEEVVGVIHEWQQSGRCLSNAVVLVREFSHSAVTECALLAAGIPYRVVGALPFFDRPLVLAMRAHLQLACGGFMGVDPVLRSSMVEAFVSASGLFLPARLRGVLVSRLQTCATLESIDADLRRATSGLPEFRRRSIGRALRTWSVLAAMSPEDSAAAAIWSVVRGHDLFASITKSASSQGRAREKYGLLREIIALASRRNWSIRALLEFMAGQSRSFALSVREKSDDALLITSIHRAKGLEWPLVIMPEIIEGHFPSCDTNVDMEDERRLFYVGLTRAVEQLTLICPPDRALVQWAQNGTRGHPTVRAGDASRFVYECAATLV